MTSNTDDPKQEPLDDRQARQERAQRAAGTHVDIHVAGSGIEAVTPDHVRRAVDAARARGARA